MHLKTPAELDASGSVLFLGAGFSEGAKNIQGTNLPVGFALRNKFAKLLKVDPTNYTLNILAEEIKSREDLNLYQTLYGLYTVRTLSDEQLDILRMPWRRIYTTNFDDAVELSRLKEKKIPTSYTYLDNKPTKLLEGSIVHLHGSIRTTTEENVLEQLVLSEQSYVRQHFEQSVWYDEFIRDLRVCDACYFVGYGLNDYHISAILLRAPNLRDKTYFITSKHTDPILQKRISPYGNLLPIEVKGFAELCRSLPRPKPSNSLHRLKAFRYLDPIKDKRTLSPPTPVEIFNLVTYGKLNYQHCLSTLPKAEYVVPRQELIDESTVALATARCLLVHSHLGNGKSVFLHILSHRLSEDGYRCFWCRDNPIFLQRDFDALSSLGRVALFFDSYNSVVELLDRLHNALPNAKFIVSIRSSIQDVRLHEVQLRLPRPVRRISLNGIQPRDTDDFKELLDYSGLRVQEMEDIIDRCSDFREVVVSLYDNELIKKRIRSALEPLARDRNCWNIFVSSNLLCWVGYNPDPGFLRSITGYDAFVEFARYPEIVRDVFSVDSDSLQVRSATFAEYLVQNHMKTDDIIECVYRIVVEVVKRKSERNYQGILSNLVKFSFLNRALKRDPLRIDALSHLFDRLHRDDGVNKEPLFWLQYSILKTTAGDLETAESFIRTAYKRAADRPHFLTFQIDTYALRLLLLIETRLPNSTEVKRFDEIIEKLEAVRSTLWEQSRRGHAIRVMELIEPFVKSRIAVFSQGEKEALIFNLDLLLQDLARLPEEVRRETGSDEIAHGVSRARQTLIRNR